MKYFIGDQHFGHNNILKFQPNREFDSVMDMNIALMAAWNAVVKPTDEVYVVGDFGFGKKSRLQWILSSLNGIKHLIVGNHDNRGRVQALHGWESTQDYLEFNYNKIKFCLFHYPIGSWNKKHRGAIHLHGHSHGNYPPIGKMLDVGVDSIGYAPISIDAIIKKLNKYDKRGEEHTT